MSIMPDSWIKKMSKEKNMIEPFADEQNKNGVISYGVSSYGYDARVSDEFKVFTNVNNALVDPKNFSEASFIERKADSCIIPPNSFVLAKTKLLGGIIQLSAFRSIKDASEKFLGSTKALFTFVKTLNSSDTLASYP